MVTLEVGPQVQLLAKLEIYGRALATLQYHSDRITTDRIEEGEGQAATTT